MIPVNSAEITISTCSSWETDYFAGCNAAIGCSIAFSVFRMKRVSWRQKTRMTDSKRVCSQPSLRAIGLRSRKLLIKVCHTKTHLLQILAANIQWIRGTLFRLHKSHGWWIRNTRCRPMQRQGGISSLRERSRHVYLLCLWAKGSLTCLYRRLRREAGCQVSSIRFYSSTT